MLFLKHENYLEIFEGLHWNSQKGKTFSLFPQETRQGVWLNLQAGGGSNTGLGALIPKPAFPGEWVAKRCVFKFTGKA